MMRARRADGVQFREMLCCPSCRGDLEGSLEQEHLRCAPCEHIYPIIEGIPILFPCNVAEEMEQLFGRHWDSEEQAQEYNAQMEGRDDLFGEYNHTSEFLGITRQYDQENLDLVLDAGCGNGRFLVDLPDSSVTVGADASLNMLRIVRRHHRGDFHVCCEIEHLPFKDGLFGTVLTCRVLQHIRNQDVAVSEMARVTRTGGNLLVEVYNRWNLKAFYKYLRMSPRCRAILNLPFRPFIRNKLPFGDWGMTYDRYNSWRELRQWFGRAGMSQDGGRGAGFGYHRYILHRSFVEMLLLRRPSMINAYYNTCLRVENLIGGLPPFRYFLEKIIVKGTKR